MPPRIRKSRIGGGAGRNAPPPPAFNKASPKKQEEKLVVDPFLPSTLGYEEDCDSSSDEEKEEDGLVFEPFSDAPGMPVKLIDEDGGMFKLTKAGGRLLDTIGEKMAVNLVFIFGNARSGKSFMMNRLLEQAGGQGPFKVINSATPCTAGVDISSSFSKHSAVAEMAGEDEPGSDNHCVGFVDVEGQGDRDSTYDTVLALPLLLTSKVILFNHKGAPTVNDMLEKLAVLTRAAEKVSLGHEDEDEDDSDEEDEDEEDEEDEEYREKNCKFGHLHILFRDFSFKGTQDSVMKQIMTPEKIKKTLGNQGGMDAGKGAADRNLIRRRLKRDFMSINVWLFKQPAKHEDLVQYQELPEEKIDADFANSVQELFEVMASQTRVVRHFNHKPVTGPRLRLLYNQVLDVLNEGADINVPSVFKAMEMDRVFKVEGEVLKAYTKALSELRKQCPMPERLLVDELDSMKEKLLNDFQDGMMASTLVDELKKAEERMLAKVVIMVRDVTRLNDEGKWAKVKEIIRGHVDNFKTTFNDWCDENFPLEDASLLETEFEERKSEQKQLVVKDVRKYPEVLKDPKFKQVIFDAMKPVVTLLRIKRAENQAAVNKQKLKEAQEEARRQKEELEEAQRKLQEQLVEQRTAANAITKELYEVKENLLKKTAEQEADMERMASELRNVAAEKKKLEAYVKSQKDAEENEKEENYELEMEGELQKKGGRRRNWKTRWCHVRNGKLSWHKNESTTDKEKGHVLLTKMSIVQIKDRNAKYDNVFIVYTNNRVLELRANTEGDMKKWVKYLSAVAQGVNKHSSSASVV